MIGKLVQQAEQEAAELCQPAFESGMFQEGLCHQIWAMQKRILKERHGIDWKSPAELNEDMLFD